MLHLNSPDEPKHKGLTFAEKVIDFNKNLHWNQPLPEGVSMMNPFAASEEVMQVSSAFYRKFYSDHQPRILVLGINPGRLGAGATGIPFTDTKRLEEKCGLKLNAHLHEPSSAFMYEMMDNFGSIEAFYQEVYINSVCPLGFVIHSNNGREINYNYYDSAALSEAAEPFILQTLKQQIAFGVKTARVFCLGTGKNYEFLRRFNAVHHLFDTIIPLEHPRFIMQYKAKDKASYIEKYVSALREALT
jgi:hypothetical protein